MDVRRLSDGPRTCNEDIDEPPRALLPLRAGRYVGDADESANEINWVEILAYVAALDCALHEGANRLKRPSVGNREHFLVIADQRMERRGDELFCCDGIN